MCDADTPDVDDEVIPGCDRDEVNGPVAWDEAPQQRERFAALDHPAMSVRRARPIATCPRLIPPSLAGTTVCVRTRTSLASMSDRTSVVSRVF